MKIDYRIDPSMPRFVRDTLDEFVEKRFARFSTAIFGVQASLLDLNGPRGGKSIRCRLVVTLARGEQVVIQETSTTVGEAIYRAFERATFALTRRMKKHREHHPDFTRRSLGPALASAS
ncbi:MAG: HPF/RaiA family ribosome-associated protein [Planctomycetaceae bacterium]|nr:HPF/RaiA family ribosome-associated protein [Planctomycetaceae bacterium]